MRAVVLAGGEGTRLRPLTTSLPKPLLPVVNRPILDHVFRLLHRHGFDDNVVTVQFLASLIRSYFGDGHDLGMTLQYATEEAPLGTAGGVRNVADVLGSEPFLVISGDAVTDIDLGAMVRYHERSGALATIGLARVPDPVEYGITVLDDAGRVTRFLEKPSWGQVFSDTVNTGIYILEPEVLTTIADGPADWSRDVFPALLAAGAPLFGYVSECYWRDVGTLEGYLQVQADVLDRKVDVEIDGFEVAPGIWIGEGADVDPGAEIEGPVYVGAYTRVEGDAALRDHTVLGDNVVVRAGAELSRAVVHADVYVGPRASLRGCLVGRGCDVMRDGRVEEGGVLGDECVVEEEAVVARAVKVYPGKTVEAGAVVTSSVVFESHGRRSLFGPRGVSGIVNVEITPELTVRLGSAFATTLRKGDSVVVARDCSRASRSLSTGIVSALTTGAVNVSMLDMLPLPVARHAVRAAPTGGGVVVRTTPGVPESVDIRVLDAAGGDLQVDAQRQIDRIYGRSEFRRAFPGEIGEMTQARDAVEEYLSALLAAVPVPEGASRPRVVVDAGQGTAAFVLPRLMGLLHLDAFTLGIGVDESQPTESDEECRRDLARLADVVASSGATFGVRFDRMGERLWLIDDKGQIVSDDRALLVMLDLVAAERAGGTIALPVTVTRVAEQVARYHGVGIRWTGTSAADLTASAVTPGLVLAGDGAGGYVIPEVAPWPDAFAAFLRLVGLVARTRLTLSEIDARIPPAFVVNAAVPTPWSTRGMVMRRVAEAAAGRVTDTTDGIRILDAGGWCLVLPSPVEAVTRLWAEGPTEEAAGALLARWRGVIEDVTA